MKLLLINPPQKHTIEGNLPAYVDESRGNIPPLGLLYTAAVVKQKTDWEVQICDMSAGDKLNHSKPDLVGITATTFTLIDALEVAKQVKEKWSVPIVLGGIHPTIYPEETANLPNVDCAFVGEAEVTFPQSIDFIASGQTRIVRGEAPDIVKLPLPARHLLDTKKYYSVLGKSGYLTTMFSSRGCPYKCVFCHRETMGKTFRARTAQQVVDELTAIYSMGIREVLVYDDTFTVNRQRVMDICQGIVKRQLRIAFDIRARIDHTDKELLENLKLAGCKRIHYGIEASSDRILKRLNKSITVEQVRNAFKLTKDIGIETLAYFIIGSPGETWHDILQTIEFAKELRPDYCHFAIMTPYPATPLYQIGLEQGLYQDYWRDFAREPTPEWQAPYWPELDRGLLLELLNRAYKNFYWQPSYIMKEIIKTRSVRSLRKKAHSAVRMVLGGATK